MKKYITWPYLIAVVFLITAVFGCWKFYDHTRLTKDFWVPRMVIVISANEYIDASTNQKTFSITYKDDRGLVQESINQNTFAKAVVGKPLQLYQLNPDISIGYMMYMIGSFASIFWMIFILLASWLHPKRK